MMAAFMSYGPVPQGRVRPEPGSGACHAGGGPGRIEINPS
jgi:hypothetical protein